MSDDAINSRVMVISGARKGIGRFLTERYLDAGWRIMGCSRGASDLEHPHYRHVCIDVADDSGVRGLFANVRSEFGRLDVVINNAGIASMNHSLLTPASTVQSILATNVMGTFLFCREGAKLMRGVKGGRIVNFATVATPLQLEGEAIYAASKAAVLSLTQILAHELASMNITVNAVGPTPVRTDLTRAVPSSKMDALIARQAVKRWGEFEDVANVVDFYLKPESSFITGQVLYLGGVS
ncbi:MAG: SDR family oxidoreductase [Verrucomicrobiaceae bacterium]|nr:SDR family oxidoreductase [Verrucomicrobiaceae bacterium]